MSTIKSVCGPKDFQPCGNDGVTHINIYSMGETSVGRMASNFQESWTVTELGTFRTLEGLYHALRLTDYYVSTGQIQSHNWDELVAIIPNAAPLQSCHGGEAIRLGRRLKQEAYGGTSYKPGAFSKEAEWIFATAMAHKLHDLTVQGVSVGNHLASHIAAGRPLTHYYVYSGKVAWPPFYHWLPELLAGIVQHIDPYDSTFDTADVINKMRGDYGLA